MKRYINYITESNEEEFGQLFSHLLHIDELEIKFNFTKEYDNNLIYVNILFYTYENEIYLTFSKKYNDVCVKKTIYDKLKDKYFNINIKYYKYLEPFLLKHFNIINKIGYNTSISSTDLTIYNAVLL